MLLIDADILGYRLGYASEKDPYASEEMVNKMVKSYVQDIMRKAKKKTTFTEAEFYLTGRTNFRNDIATTAPYKGNRSDKAKPIFLPSIRDYLINNYNALISVDQEADDAISIRATELGDDCAICSIDKDFDQVPGWHYNFVKDHYYYVTPEEGLFFFYRQILMGDRIDNIIGINGIGEKKSAKILEGMTEQEMYDKCVELHESEERVIENARLLWLRREEGQLWEPPHETTK